MTHNPEPLWAELSPLQADGLACVVCGRNFLQSGLPSRPVGRSHTGSQVFACGGECEPAATEESPAPDQAWFWTPEWQAGEREATQQITAGQTTVLGSDEEFTAWLTSFAEDDATEKGADR